jgi:hypothetical protein
MTIGRRFMVGIDVFKIALPASVAGAFPFAYALGEPDTPLTDWIRIVALCATAAISAAAWGYLLAPSLISEKRVSAALAGAALPILSLHSWLTAIALLGAISNAISTRGSVGGVGEAIGSSFVFSAYGIALTGWFLIPLGVGGALLLRRRHRPVAEDEPGPRLEHPGQDHYR